jgi:uncharacterized membrane protein YhaH (DUF805 family)
MGNYIIPWKKYARFSGRATRAEFWTFALTNAVIFGVFGGIGASSTDLTDVAYTLGGVFIFAAAIPSLAVLIRRLHDTGRSGGWFFLAVIPFIGHLWLFVLTLLGGTVGPNQYGPDPQVA